VVGFGVGAGEIWSAGGDKPAWTMHRQIGLTDGWVGTQHRGFLRPSSASSGHGCANRDRIRARAHAFTSVLSSRFQMPRADPPVGTRPRQWPGSVTGSSSSSPLRGPPPSPSFPVFSAYSPSRIVIRSSSSSIEQRRGGRWARRCVCVCGGGGRWGRQRGGDGGGGTGGDGEHGSSPSVLLSLVAGALILVTGAAPPAVGVIFIGIATPVQVCLLTSPPSPGG
jgi:hypothetical protein